MTTTPDAHSVPTCPPPSPARPSGCRAGCTAAASWPGSPSSSCATAPASPRSWCAAGADVPPEETTVEVVGTATANPQAPGGIEVTEPTITRADRRRPTPRRSSCGGPTLNAGAADAARPRRRSPGDTRASGRSGSWPRPSPARLPRRRSTRLGFTEVADAEARGVGDRVAAPTSSRSTTSAGRRTSPRARSSTSSSWSGSSSGSTRSGRCSAPSRTTRSGTWRSTSRSTSSSASSTTTAT